MLHLAASSQALAAGVAGVQPRADDRLPIPQAALLVVAMSVGLWSAIALAIRWLAS